MKPGKTNKKVIIISKFFAPVNSVDSNSVYDLVIKLINQNPALEINIVTTDISYKSDVKLRTFDSLILNKFKIHRLNPIRVNIKGSMGRIINDLITGFYLVYYSKKLNIKTIISLSNPPFIGMWCNMLLFNRNFIYWSFDLFPDALISSGVLKSKSLLNRLLNYLNYKYPPFGIIALGPKQFEYLNYKYLRGNFQNKINRIIYPCGIHQEIKTDSKPGWFEEDKIIVGYVGNIGKAHSKNFLINIINQINNYSNIKLVLSIYGEHASSILQSIDKIKDKSNIEIIPPVSQNELSYIQIHLVSLLHEWTNISVPSKAVSAICSESVLWFSGSTESDTYHFFKDCSYYSKDNFESIKEVLDSISICDFNIKKAQSALIKENLFKLESQSIIKISELIK
jgi:glycosyltransferase involved in cell wall biosynthesis